MDRTLPGAPGDRGLQADWNRLETALVLAEDRAAYFSVTGSTYGYGATPRGGLLFTDRLEPVIEIEPSDELRARREAVAAWTDLHHPNRGYMTGDLAKGGRPASLEELRRLRGKNKDGLPIGLGVCSVCAQVRGECLDTNRSFAGLLVTVHCRCDNDNLCARCGKHLNDTKLNGNHYNARDGRIGHTPGFSGLRHRCADRR